jgi:hypothetical protein
MTAKLLALIAMTVLTAACSGGGYDSSDRYDEDSYEEESYSEPRANPLTADEATEMNDLSLKSRPLTLQEGMRHEELWNKFEGGEESEEE